MMRAADEPHDEERAHRARDLQRFQPVDEGVERVGQQEGKEERNEHPPKRYVSTSAPQSRRPG